jgi:hypothetical protein
VVNAVASVHTCKILEQVEKKSGNKYYRQILISKESAFVLIVLRNYCQIDLMSRNYSTLMPFCGDNHCIFQ